MTLVFLAVALTISAQVTIPKLELKHNGFVGSDSTKNYIVIDVPSFKKNDLFKKILVYLNSIYKDPQRVISSVEGESITINGYTDVIKGSLDWYKYPLNYNINIQFKDGKMRFEPTITDFSEVWSDNNPPRKVYVCAEESQNKIEINCIWMPNKKEPGYWLFKADLKTSLDKWVNNYVVNMVKGLDDKW